MAATLDLFDEIDAGHPATEALAEGAVVLRGYAREYAESLLSEIEAITGRAPFRHLVTPGGHRMSVAMSNCGRLGWVSDRRGYRYDAVDPESGLGWPEMPAVFARLARDAAAQAGFEGFAPEACLINRYRAGTKLSLHRDYDEQDFGAPIVSVSLGLPAVFLFGGFERGDPSRRIRLAHGDVVVWGGASRLRYHGVMPLKEGHHPQLGAQRINLTFRKVD